MGGHLLPALAWLGVSIYGAGVIFRELRPALRRLRVRQQLGIRVPRHHVAGLWSAGVGGSLAWTALLGVTALHLLS
ncbi:hypothetical protein [Limnochorda pilosa]|uniref:Uncharacterized protein n=1 Tax=Limnochorda pilosa TaxID=1555112 RepID=A0A0K2SJG8_LIMPI|nr:hypothetical protein [Limnochorda pilosa]BAS27261.1 hypothetical protein LIP_1410 [Limnochorda pilosa]